MKQQIQNRIDELKKELEVGRTALRDLEAQSQQIRSQMLRINGAIQVLHELLEDADNTASGPVLKTVNG